MATWSTRRKYAYFFAFFLGLVIVVGVPAVYLLYEKPTCSDGKQNGKETGVDCSGACSRLCPADFTAPRVLWAHSMKVVPGVYNALAYAQNPNSGVQAKSVPYFFKFYDQGGSLISERSGWAYVPAGQRFPIFEGGIQTGTKTISRTTFQFGPIPSWEKGKALDDIKVVDTKIDETDSPVAEVSIKNESINKGYTDLDAFVILYDAEGNRVAFSKTVIDKISPSASAKIFFTWPEAFSKPVVRTELLFVQRIK